MKPWGHEKTSRNFWEGLPCRILQIGVEDLEAELPRRACKLRPNPWSARSRHQNQVEQSVGNCNYDFKIFNTIYNNGRLLLSVYLIHHIKIIALRCYKLIWITWWELPMAQSVRYSTSLFLNFISCLKERSSRRFIIASTNWHNFVLMCNARTVVS